VVSREYFLDQITMALGGRASEETFFGQITTGASNDLQQATRIARAMIMEYGMSDALGLPTYGSGSANPFVGREFGYFGGGRDYSEEAARAIDGEVKRILTEGYERALSLIRNNRDRMVKLAKTLMEVETLDRKEFEKLMNEPANGQLHVDAPFGEQMSEPLGQMPRISPAAAG
jgi:cell division protease FtsH